MQRMNLTNAVLKYEPLYKHIITNISYQTRDFLLFQSVCFPGRKAQSTPPFHGRIPEPCGPILVEQIKNKISSDIDFLLHKTDFIVNCSVTLIRYGNTYTIHAYLI